MIIICLSTSSIGKHSVVLSACLCTNGIKDVCPIADLFTATLFGLSQMSVNYHWAYSLSLSPLGSDSVAIPSVQVGSDWH